MAADEPPYLTVGTDVSAKYKGAFCEAKIKKVNRMVKCKVTFQNNQGSLMVPDDQIRGSLRIGALIEARHPEKNQYLDAVINKMQDYSQYTVVFDDGDETTLRRTSLCLKSGRHFAESPTLDQFPLTNPEHFGTPVIGVVKSKRKRRSTYNSAALDYSSSDEELVPKKTKSPRSREKDRDVGKVICVEYGDRRKKDNWYPGLVVLVNSSQDTFKINTKEEYLIRSFKDGKYYQVPKKDTREFSRDVSRKVESNTLKTAVEKALLYCEKGELPPHWDKALYLGLETASGDDDLHDTDSDTSDDEPSEEKDRFVAQLYKFMDERGTPINKAPTVSNKDVNLYKLFKVVHKMGGYNRVTNQNKWKIVYTKMGLQSSNPSGANQLKVAYKRFLHSFEDFYRKLGCTMVTNSRSTRGRHRSDRNFMITRNAVSTKVKGKNKDKSLENKTEEKYSSVERKEAKGKSDSVKSEEKTKKKIEKIKTEDKETKTKPKKEEDKPRLVRSQSLNKDKKDTGDEKKDTRTDRARTREESKKEKTESPEKKETRSSAKLEQERDKMNKSSSETKSSDVKESKERSPREKGLRELKPADRKDETPQRERKLERSWRDRLSKEEKPRPRSIDKLTEKKDEIKEKKDKPSISDSPKHESKIALREKREKQLASKAVKEEPQLKLEKEETLEIKCPPVEKETKIAKAVEPKVEEPKATEKPNLLKPEESELLVEVKVEKMETDLEPKPSTSQGDGPSSLQNDDDNSKEGINKDLKGPDEGEDSKSFIDLTDSDDDIGGSGSDKERQIDVGDKVKVKYGRGRTCKVYEAKVLKVDVVAGEKKYFVHYAGWNIRYDEWIRRNFIVENVTERTKLSRQKRLEMAKGSLPLMKRSLLDKTRPPGFPSSKPIRKNSTSSTTSVSSSRTTRSEKNNSFNSSPLSRSLHTKRRMRRKSGISTALTDTSQDSESDDDFPFQDRGPHDDNDDEERDIDSLDKSFTKDENFSDQEMETETSDTMEKTSEVTPAENPVKPTTEVEREGGPGKISDPFVSLDKRDIPSPKESDVKKPIETLQEKRPSCIFPTKGMSVNNDMMEEKFVDKKQEFTISSMDIVLAKSSELSTIDAKSSAPSTGQATEKPFSITQSVTKPCDVKVSLMKESDTKSCNVEVSLLKDSGPFTKLFADVKESKNLEANPQESSNTSVIMTETAPKVLLVPQPADNKQPSQAIELTPIVNRPPSQEIPLTPISNKSSSREALLISASITQPSQEVKSALACSKPTRESRSIFSSIKQSEIKSTPTSNKPPNQESRPALTSNKPLGQESRPALISKPSGQESRPALTSNKQSGQEIRSIPASNKQFGQEIWSSPSSNKQFGQEIWSSPSSNKPPNQEITPKSAIDPKCVEEKVENLASQKPVVSSLIGKTSEIKIPDCSSFKPLKEQLHVEEKQKNQVLFPSVTEVKPREKSSIPNVVQHVGSFGDIKFSPRTDLPSRSLSLSPRPAKKIPVQSDTLVSKDIVKEEIVQKKLPTKVVNEKPIVQTTAKETERKDAQTVTTAEEKKRSELDIGQTDLTAKSFVASVAEKVDNKRLDVTTSVETVESKFVPFREVPKADSETKKVDITTMKAEPEAKPADTGPPKNKYSTEIGESKVPPSVSSFFTSKPHKEETFPPFTPTIIKERETIEKDEDTCIFEDKTDKEEKATDAKDTALQTSVITFVSSSSSSSSLFSSLSSSSSSTADFNLMDKKMVIDEEEKPTSLECNNENTDDYEVSQAIESLTTAEPKPPMAISPKREIAAPKISEDEQTSTSTEESLDDDDEKDCDSITANVTKTDFDENIQESLTELSLNDESRERRDKQDKGLFAASITNVFSNLSAEKTLTDIKELFVGKKTVVDASTSEGRKEDSESSNAKSISIDSKDDGNKGEDSSLKEFEDNGSSCSLPTIKKEGKKKKSKIARQEKKGSNPDFYKKDDLHGKEGKGKSKKKKIFDGDEPYRPRDSEQKSKSKKFKKSKNKKRFSKYDDSLDMKEEDFEEFSEKLKRKEKRRREEKKFSKFDSRNEGTSGERSKKEKKKGRKNKLCSDRKSEFSEKKLKEKRKIYDDDNVGDSDSEKDVPVRVSEKRKKKEKKKPKIKEASSSDDTTEGKLLIDEAKLFSDLEDKNKDPDMSFLLCEEKVPASPVSALPEDTTASSSIDDSNNVSPSSDEEQIQARNAEVYAGSSGISSSANPRSVANCVRFIHRNDNTPPTTPSSSESIPSSSPSRDQEPFVHYTESTQSGRDSGDNESDGFPCNPSHVEVSESEEYSAASVLAFSVCKSVTEKPQECPRPAPKRHKSESEEYSPMKRRKKMKRSFGMGETPVRSGPARVRGLSHTPKGESFDDFEVDNYPRDISSPPHMFSSFSHPSSQSTPIPLDGTSGPNKSRHNFYIPLHEYKDPEKRISILQDKMSELRKLYASLKAEVASIDRRRKKARKKMREAAGSNMNISLLTHSDEGQNCS